MTFCAQLAEEFFSKLSKRECDFFQALRYWKILFSPSDFEPTSVRNCQFLTLPVRNCQHADPYQVLGLEQSEQQWMSPRVNPGGIAKQLPPGWKSTSVPGPAVKGGNTACLKSSWRYAIFWTENIVNPGGIAKSFPQGEKAPLSSNFEPRAVKRGQHSWSLFLNRKYRCVCFRQSMK